MSYANRVSEVSVLLLIMTNVSRKTLYRHRARRIIYLFPFGGGGTSRRVPFVLKKKV